MRLASFRDAEGHSGVGVVRGTQLVALDVAPLPGLSAMRVLLGQGPDLGEVIFACSTDVTLALDSVVLEPVVPDPGKIVAAPVNYRDHQKEMAADTSVDGLGVFLKAPSSVIADGGTVRLPYDDRRFDQEGELAVVIGRATRHVTPAHALQAIAGYTMLLDITMRGGEDRSTRKSFDTFTPVGPWLVTPDEAPDPRAMRLRTWVDGALRQDADVADLIWSVPRLIAYVSSVMTLHPGDIVTTGTPAGVGEIRGASEIIVEIQGVGRLTVGVDSEGAVPCPTKGTGRGPRPPETVTPTRQRSGER
jgi:2-keto-4-pentenoate hydratase/2-oxohepta-3-ene-1,7-dioic acid hydratase in catechol pathway